MNPLLTSFLTGLLRHAITGVAGYFVAKGIFTADQMDNYVTAGIAAFISIVWMAWVKYGDRVNFVKALEAPAGMPEDAVKAKPTPDSVAAKVLGLLLAVALVGAGAACASRNGVQVSPEGTVALRANQFVQALRTTITPAGASPIEQLVASKVITPNDAVQVTLVIRQTFVYAQDLAAVLKVVDDAKTAGDRQQGLVKAAALAQAAADSLAQASLSVGTEAGRKAVVSALRTASQALLLVGSILPAGSGLDDGAFAASLAAAGA